MTGSLILDGNNSNIINTAQSQDNLFRSPIQFKKIGSAGNNLKTGIWAELGRIEFFGHDGNNPKNQAQIVALNNSETTSSSGGSYIKVDTRCSDGNMLNTMNVAANGSSINGCASVPLTVSGLSNNVEMQLVNNSDTGTHTTVSFILKDNSANKIRGSHIQTNLYDRTPNSSSSTMTLATLSNGQLQPTMQLSTSQITLNNSARLRFGNNGADHIVGTGFPNGVVAAPVGSIYVDKNLTRGASLWIKQTGNGNTGWRVLSGDTGWINCDTIFEQLFDSSDPLDTGCKIRRVNNTVHFTIKAKVKTISEISVNIKNGGFSSGDTIPQPIIIQQLRNTGKSAQMQISNYSFLWLPGYNGTKVGDRVACNSSYTTTADWPTILTFKENI